MKIRPFILMTVLGLMLGLAFAATFTQRASAACYDPKTKQPIPCPPKDKVKKPTATDVPPTSTPSPTATPVPTSSATPVTALVVPTPPASGTDNAACAPSPLGGLLAGAGLLAAGIILRAVPVPGTAAGTADAFGYAPSQGQGRVIGTSFGGGSARANDRLRSADPVPQNGGVTGASGRADAILRAARLARLLSLAGMGVGGLLMVIAAGQYGGILGCVPWSAPAASGGLSLTGVGLGVAIVAVAGAWIYSLVFKDAFDKYTLFLPNGTPYRGTVHVAMKNPGGQSGKTDSDSSTDDDPDGDGH